MENSRIFIRLFFFKHVCRMNLDEQFRAAVALTQKLSQRPTNEVLLKIYALYKQVTVGDVTGEKPVGFDFKAAAKYNAWESLKGKGKEECMKTYIEIVNSLK